MLCDRQRTQMPNPEKKSSRSAQEAFNQSNYLTVSTSCTQQDSSGSRYGSSGWPRRQGKSYGHHQEREAGNGRTREQGQPGVSQGPWDWRTGWVWDTTGLWRLATAYRETPHTTMNRFKQRSDTEGAVSCSYKALTPGVKHHKQDTLIK